MPIYQLGDRVPTIDPTAYIHPEAVIIGDVTVGALATVWPSAVLRGDYGTIVIGDRSSVQDGTVIHAGPGFPTMVGEGCVIGHLAHLEGCTLEDDSLVGSGLGCSPPCRDRSRRHGWSQRRGAEQDDRSTRARSPLGYPSPSVKGSRRWSSSDSQPTSTSPTDVASVKRSPASTDRRSPYLLKTSLPNGLRPGVAA